MSLAVRSFPPSVSNTCRGPQVMPSAAPYPFTTGPLSNQGSQQPVRPPRPQQKQQQQQEKQQSGAGAAKSPGRSPARKPPPRADAIYANYPNSGATTPAASTTSLAPKNGGGRTQLPVQAAFVQRPMEMQRSFGSSGSLNMYDSPYLGFGPSSTSLASIAEKFDMSPDPSQWGGLIHPGDREDDDYLHNPDPRRDRRTDRGGTVWTMRGLGNLGCLLVIGIGLLGLFAGYPLATYLTKTEMKTFGAWNIGGINASGQVPQMNGNFGMIDLDTPKDAYTKSSYNGKGNWQLVFSDEFNQDGRTFYPGDDPYWEAVDLHYWETNDLEWYDPSAITTANGSLHITLSRTLDPTINHNLDYKSGMMSTWNKFCFTGGLVEASVMLPGAPNVAGLWPAVWTMGNLGRAGYGASLEGMWPYSYDACDVGTAPNQTKDGLPIAATENGDTNNGGALSYLPGQRLSRCTCSGESHPGPMHSDGTYVGRSAPEIDVYEAQTTGDPLTGQVSQSCQWAPFNAEYEFFNTSGNFVIANPEITEQNTYTGGVTQQATSCVTDTDQGCYELTKGCYSTYGMEYQPGFDDAYISWIASDKLACTLNVAGMAADTRVEISSRPIPQEPMYLIMNLGLSENFVTIDFDHLTFPATMRVDWIRVYQPSDAVNVGCEPEDFPTQSYINAYPEAYTNANLTTWRDDYKQPFPKNSFLGQC